MRVANMSRGLMAGVLLSVSTCASAEVFDANASGDSVRIVVSGPLSRLISNLKGEYDLGGLFGNDNRDEDIWAGHAGVMLTGDAGAQQANVTAGLGARLQYVDAEFDDGGALELGGRLEVRMPGYDRVGVSAYAWYGPEAASFGDLDDVFEYAVAIDYEILRDAAIYIGYRKLKADFGDAGEAEEDGVHGGIRLEF
ncbi:MAG: YfaZ family outer membrane protein [Panacagrimonas sp.]